MMAQDYIQINYPTMFTDTNLALWISAAVGLTSSVYFGVNYQLAIALRAMHQYSLAQRNNGEAGSVTGEHEGGLSINFGVGKPNGGYTNQNLEQTHWGIQLKDLIRGITPAIAIVGAVTLNQPLPPAVAKADNIANDFLNDNDGFGTNQ